MKGWAMESKKQYFDRVVEELNLDIRDPFTLLLANAFALCDQRDTIKRENAVLRRKLDEMEAVLRKYGQHRSTCTPWRRVNLGCECGLDAALSTDGEMKEES